MDHTSASYMRDMIKKKMNSLNTLIQMVERMYGNKTTKIWYSAHSYHYSGGFCKFSCKSGDYCVRVIHDMWETVSINEELI